MALKQQPMYGITCDNCKRVFVTDNDFAFFLFESDAIEEAENYEWYIGIGKNEPDLCDLCHSFDDDDNLIVNTERKI